MADKFMTSPMMLHKFIPSVDDNQWLERVDTQLNETTMKVPKVVNTTNKKT